MGNKTSNEDTCNQAPPVDREDFKSVCLKYHFVAITNFVDRPLGLKNLEDFSQPKTHGFELL